VVTAGVRAAAGDIGALSPIYPHRVHTLFIYYFSLCSKKKYPILFEKSACVFFPAGKDRCFKKKIFPLEIGRFNLKSNYMEINTSPQKIQEVLKRGVEDIVDQEHLEKQMKSGKQLRIKLGIDPTAADLHLGHSVVLRKLAQFQELGHKAVLIIGDFTTRIGDPSGRTNTRKPLTEEEIKQNMKNYIDQASMVIDIKAAEIHYNGEWYGSKPMSFLMDLAGRFTVARMLDREDFQKRIKQGLDVSLLELLYPLLQGYDSVACKADVELGGYDQRLNVLFARRVQKKFGIDEQDVLTVPLLIGTDGEKKMSKSLGNYISLTEEPKKMYTQMMAVPDTLMWNYFELLTARPKVGIDDLKKEVAGAKKHPRDVKMMLAEEIIAGYHGQIAADKAREEFINVAQLGALPSDVPVARVAGRKLNILDLLVKIMAVSSKSEAKRLVVQNGVKIDGFVKNDWREVVATKEGQVVQIGKNKFFRIG
jgi:tyrosyl-tRNA synthetase